ncbi:MAG: hypothetical protein ABL921_32925 [Pirellula sp.]
MFPKRCLDSVTGEWTVSAYVLAESGYATKVLSPNHQNKMFAIVEDKVEKKQLGFAFADRSIAVFRRTAIDETLCKPVGEFLDKLLENRPRFETPQHLELEKIITAYRNGWANVEVRHRFRVRHPGPFHREHFLWRVREPLPQFDFTKNPSVQKDGSTFSFIATRLGKHTVDRAIPQICATNQKKSDGRTVQIDVRFPKFTFEIGDIIEYMYSWSYPRAFVNDNNNSVAPQSGGMWSCLGNSIDRAIFRLRFERLHSGNEWVSPIELVTNEQLKISRHLQNGFPLGAEPANLWHSHDGWQDFGFMEKVPKEQEVQFECYSWETENFLGMAKATWSFRENFLQEGQRQLAKDSTRRPGHLS